MNRYIYILMIMGLVTVSSIEALDRWGDVVESKVDVIDLEVSECCVIVNSKLDVIDDKVDNISVNDQVVDSKLDVIDDELSSHDAIINSKIGDLDNSGSCLDSVIDVPDDINNLNMNVIELLKTILLELRGGC